MSDWQVELEVCKDEIEQLTEWERSFITSIADQVDRGRNLSEKQTEVLHRIYNKVV